MLKPLIWPSGYEVLVFRRLALFCSYLSAYIYISGGSVAYFCLGPFAIFRFAKIDIVLTYQFVKTQILNITSCSSQKYIIPTTIPTLLAI